MRHLGPMTLSVVGTAAGLAIAQIAPPPGPFRGDAPPPSTTAFPPQSPPTMPEDGCPRPIDDPPPLPYDSLVQRDESDRVIPLDLETHEAALARNPLVDRRTLERCHVVARSRRIRMERLVLAQLEVVERVRRDGFLALDENDPASLLAEVEALRPFIEIGTLTDDLHAQGVFSEMTRRMNWRIVMEYESARAAESPSFLHALLRRVMDEPLRLYESLIAKACDRFDESMAGVEIPGRPNGIAADLARQARDSSDAMARAKAMEALLQWLSIEDRRSVLSRSLSTR